MSLEIFQSVLTGSLGALALLCICVWALVKGIVHPDSAYQEQVGRVKLYEHENTRLNASIVQLTETNTQLQVDVATLRKEVGYLNDRLTRALEARNHG
jgi:hypothetical protein